MAELVFQTWQRVTGKPWSAAKAGGFTTGSSGDNLALQKKLLSGYNPYAPPPAPAPAPAPAAPAPAPTQQFIKETFKEEVPKAVPIANQESDKYEAKVSALDAAVEPKQQALVEALKNRSNLETLFNTLRDERGVTASEGLIRGIQQSAIDVEGLLSGLPEDVLARSRGSRVTEAQRNAVQAKEGGKLEQNLSGLLRGAERERSGLDLVLKGIEDAVNIRGTQEARDIEPVSTELGFANETRGLGRTDAAARLANVLTASGIDIGTATQMVDALVKERVGSEAQTRDFQNNTALQAQQGAISKELANISAAAARSSGGGGFTPPPGPKTPTTPATPSWTPTSAAVKTGDRIIAATGDQYVDRNEYDGAMDKLIAQGYKDYEALEILKRVVNGVYYKKYGNY